MGSTALATMGSYTKAADITAALERAQQVGHLVSPFTTGISLAPGVEVAVSAVQVDVARETYATASSGGGDDEGDGGGNGKRGLAKSALDRIAASYSVSWDAERSGRLDDGSDPHYCHFRAIGTYLAFDGRPVEISGEKEMDLREGSPQIRGMVETSTRKIKRTWPRGTPLPADAELQRQGREKAENQIRMMRLHILGHAESKARNRAVRTAFGIRASYEVAELQKPFIVAHPIFTGATDDPTLRPIFAEKIADAFLSGRNTAFGGARAPRQLVARRDPARVIDVHMPPPVGSVTVDEDDDAPEPPRTPSATSVRPPARDPDEPPFGDPAPLTQPSAGAQVPEIDTSKFFLGKDKTPVNKASDKDLSYWGNRIEKDLQEGKVDARYVTSNREKLAAIDYEIAKRKGIESPNTQLPLDGDRGDSPEAY